MAMTLELEEEDAEGKKTLMSVADIQPLDPDQCSKACGRI
jgi:hypothetical protein